MTLKIFVALVLSSFIGLVIFPLTAQAATSCDTINSISIDPSSGDLNTSFRVTGQIANCDNTQLPLIIVSPGGCTNSTNLTVITNLNTDANGDFDLSGLKMPKAGSWEVRILNPNSDCIPQSSTLIVEISDKGPTKLACGDTITIEPPDNPALCPPSCPPANNGGAWKCSGIVSSGGIPASYCDNNKGDPACIPSNSNGEFCDPGNTKIKTAIGCIPTSLKDFIPALIKYSFALGGGIALLLMIIGAFQMLTSAGNPESVKKGREQFVAAASGLVFIILSTVLLRIIGVDILAITNF